MVKSGEDWAGLIVTRDATGALLAAGVGPAGTLYVNGVANAAVVTVAGANPYSWTVTLPALLAHDCVSMYITATVDGIATAAVVAEDVAEIQSGLATEASLTTVSTNVSTLLSRLGAFTGTGVNTVLGFLKAIMSKAASTPSDVGGTFAASTDSLEAIRDGGTITPVGGAVVGSTVTVYTYSNWDVDLTIGDITDRVAGGLVFTVKRDPRGDEDSESVYQVRETTGALYIDGAAAASAAYGAVTVTDAADGDITVTLSVTGVGDMAPARGLRWEAKVITATGARVVASGAWNVDTAVSRAVA